jgi:hypothetical protein
MRALLAACALLPALVLGGPADAAGLSSCEVSGAITVADFETVTGGPVSVKINQPRGDQNTYVCVDTPATAWVLVLRVGTTSELPLHATATPGTCPLTLIDAGGFYVSIGATAQPSVCFSQGSWRTTYTVGPPFGENAFADVEVWRGGGRVTDNAFCLQEWIVYLQSPWAPDDYTPCYYGAHKVV